MLGLVRTFVTLGLVALVHGSRHDELLAGGFQYFEDVGYYYYGTYKNWSFAQHDCYVQESRLVVINSERERQTVVSFLRNNTDDDYVYAGFTNKYDFSYVTTEGLPMENTGYTNWEEGKPSGETGRCGVINTSTGQLSDMPCEDDQMSYVCEHKLWNDYEYVKDVGYYKLHTQGMVWIDAFKTCEREGAHLLVLDTQKEVNAVMEIYNQYPEFPNADGSNWVHIGIRAVMEEYMSDQPENGTFLTIFGSSVSDLGYVNWNVNEPHLYPGVLCGVLTRSNAGYSTFYCGSRFAFFCEKEIEKFHKT